MCHTVSPVVIGSLILRSITNDHRKSWLKVLDYALLAVIERHIEKPMLAGIELDKFMPLNI